jgi:4-hydroxybenzoate polyprenyltransferase
MRQPPEKTVLVVDLDGTLIRTDMLHESFWAGLSSNLRVAGSTLKYLRRGRAALKAHLASCTELDCALLPYNEAVLEIIGKWRDNGGRVALVTAADQNIAISIAGFLGVFDEVHGSDGARNLKGPTKAAFLVDQYGAGGFDYMGNAYADLPIWERSRRGLTVDASVSLRAAVENVSTDVQHVDSMPGNGTRTRAAYAKALRPHQWLKNILVFLPAVAAKESASEVWTQSILAFVAFCLVASSVYSLNDLLDLAADRSHPRKRERPFASGAIPLAHGAAMSLGLAVAGFLVSLTVGRPEFVFLLLSYYGLTLAYSLYLKRRLVVDICTLACLFSLRVLGGGLATGISLSEWLLAFSIFIFWSLAALKRQAELADGAANGRLQSVGRAYHNDDLPMVAAMAIGSGYVSVLVMALYINSPTVQSLYAHPQFLWGICLALLFWISHMAMAAHRGTMDDDPIVFAMRDRVSRVCGLLVALLVVAGNL